MFRLNCFLVCHVSTMLQHCTDFIIYTCLLYSRESAILVIDETFFSQPFLIKHSWLTHTPSVERFSENFSDEAVTYFIFFVGMH